MSFITLDFETYYTKDYGLNNLTTEEYIQDPRFEVIGVSVKVDGAPAEWFSGSHDAIKTYLQQFNWSESALLAHNAMFDGAILAWRFGIVPAMYFDTLCVARALHGVDVSGSLASLVKRYNLGEKGTEVINALGKKRADFDAVDLARYGEYCKNDTELTYKLFNVLAPKFFDSEFVLIDMTLRMYTQPMIRIDDALLITRLDEIREEKQALLASLKEKLECATEEDVRKKLASNPQFADVLRKFGVDPPKKISPTTGKETYAFAKNDEGFIALSESEDLAVQQICAVRLGTKSTIEESRIERFIDIGARNKGFLPIPLKYYGAHTGRWAGSESVNLQNIPSRDKKKKALKNALVAPPGHLIINSDSSQIEARVLAWLAKQNDVVEQFRNNQDVYSIFASKIYKKEISKSYPVERFVGKTCVLGLGFGTGAAKLRHTLKTQPPGADIDEDECKRIVSIYRETNYRITELWQECEHALDAMIQNVPSEYSLVEDRPIRITKAGIQLPNGLHIYYPELRFDDEQRMYNSRKGPIKIWGGYVVENIVQALARIIVANQMIAIEAAGYKVALTVHDAAACVVKEPKLEQAITDITSIMSTPPEWAAGLPLACEVKYGRSYGEC